MADRATSGLVPVLRRSLRKAIATGVAIASAWPVAALAAGLGPAVQQSSLGQSLRIVIPVLLGPGEDYSGECFRLVAAERDPDGIPQALFGRVAFERTGESARIVVTNPRPVNDPVLRLTVQVGCEAGVRREYTLLMDPPVIDVPIAEAESEPVTGTAASAAVARDSRRAVGGAPASAGRATPRGSAPGTRTVRKTSPGRMAAASKAPSPRRPPPPSAEGGPRLKVSRATPGATTPEAPGNEGPTPQEVRAQQDLADALEAETVVLRQRVAELSATVDRMQEQVRAQEAQQRAADEAAKAAAEAARASPLHRATLWWEANWPLVALIVGLPLLIAGGLTWKRRRDATHVEPWRVSGSAGDRFESTSTLTETPPTRRSGKSDSAQKPDPMRRSTTGANALAVSELSQITEEARVYVALGHADRAMNVLRDHIRQMPRAIPAAWLMLLDLYHAHGRRQEFRQLAQEFHQRCNVQAPTWEDYSAESDAAGLDGYPHVAKRIVGLWRMPECRDYLERLLYDNRDGQRNGFSLAAYGDILTLLQILDAPVVDIDSDLAEEGKLRAAWTAPAKEARLVGAPDSADRSLTAAAAGATAHPTQDSIVFELDADWQTPKPPPGS